MDGLNSGVKMRSLTANFAPGTIKVVLFGGLD